MTSRPIMDAGPGLNFFSLNKERLLFATLGAMAMPEIVHNEIRKKALQEPRFAPAGRVLAKLPEKFLQVLSDDVTEELSSAVSRMAGMPMEKRMHSSKDLGETMVVAHAVVAAEQGKDVLVLIDDSDGRRVAAMEARRLDRLREAGQDVGKLRLISTMTVLRNAAGKEYLPDRQSMRDLYERLRGLDDGLIAIEQTDLLRLSCWD